MPKKNEGRPRVLMIDDDSDFQSIVCGWLAPHYDHVILSDGEALMDELADLDPQLVILDVNMPGPNGFTLCRRIRCDQRYADLPVLFVTGRKEDEAFLANLDVGGTAFMTKPVERKRLLSVVRELIEA
jgi:DNA-binding response OmpR family regulator